MNNNFNDIVAQLYQQEFKTQEKAKYEHIKQDKEKSLDEKRAEADRITRENSQEPEQANVEATQGISRGDEAPNEAINGNIGNDWSSVSPEIDSKLKTKK